MSTIDEPGLINYIATSARWRNNIIIIIIIMVIVSQAYTVSAGRGNVTALHGLNPTETTYAAVLLRLLLLFGWLARARSSPTAQARINERPVALAPLELNYIAFISSLCFYARGTTEGGRQTNEAAPSLLCPTGREVVVWGGRRRRTSRTGMCEECVCRRRRCN